MVILFDGVCNLCNSFVQFVIKEDRDKIFKFASLQSDFGQAEVAKALELAEVDSVILVSDHKIFIKSDAALEILKKLPRFSWLYIFRFIPLRVRDGVYEVIAKNRYRIFGKRETCMIPTPELTERFHT
ncbi:thiol-disulfide oxidoreductase DCC family protein [Jiulongibacter sp. NS-SX5]|uniref:thiol-disulfide oxidoreductase DCC family protein n=1 Tax=Jiulongibacter sp. NS-SX5 TaxID=3463854 RepID=UPI0040589A97